MTTTTPEFGSLREKIAWEKEERAARYARFAAAMIAANEAAQVAGEEAYVAPSIVGTAIGLSNEIDYSKPVYHDTAGVCGFAWVDVYPATGSFACWLRKNGLGTKAYRGGMRIRMTGFGQSYERKYAAAQVFAGVLSEMLADDLNGARILPGGRLD